MSPSKTAAVGQAHVDPRAPLTEEKGRALRQIWLRLIAFLFPIVAVLAPTVYWIDPFDLFHAHSPIPLELRMHYAAPINQALWKVFAYSRQPAPNILLGDSETARLPGLQVSLAAGEPYVNLGAGGGTLRESIDMFWLAARKTQLKHVVFGIDFMSYNADPRDRVPQAEAIARNPVFYFLNFDVLEAGAYQSAAAFLHYPSDIGPEGGREALWQSQLRYLGFRYRRLSSPGDLRHQLVDIVTYCREHGISFKFLIPPQHVDAQHRVQMLGAAEQYRDFKQDLAEIAPVYDCDIDSSFTRNRNNFADPFHMTDDGAREFVSDLWAGHSSFCRGLKSQ